MIFPAFRRPRCGPGCRRRRVFGPAGAADPLHQPRRRSPIAPPAEGRAVTAVTVRPAPPADRAAAFALAFGHLPPEERQAKAAAGLELLTSGEVDPDGLLVAEAGGRAVGAMLACPLPGGGAAVWPPHAAPGAPAD